MCGFGCRRLTSTSCRGVSLTFCERRTSHNPIRYKQACHYSGTKDKGGGMASLTSCNDGRTNLVTEITVTVIITGDKSCDPFTEALNITWGHLHRRRLLKVEHKMLFFFLPDWDDFNWIMKSIQMIDVTCRQKDFSTFQLSCSQLQSYFLMLRFRVWFFLYEDFESLISSCLILKMLFLCVVSSFTSSLFVPFPPLWLCVIGFTCVLLISPSQSI